MFPTMGFRLLMNGVIVMIVAGVGNIRGLVAGALLLAVSQHVTAYFWGSKWIDAATAVILIAFLLLKPLGFSGRMIKKVEI
jgi:branched-chain amino acid transport system permease protein